MVTSKTFRKRHRYHSLSLVGLGAILLGVIVFLGMSRMTAQSPWRQTVALVSDSAMYIASWDASKTHVVLILVPGTTVIEGVHGYGAYQIDSLYKLDAIDRKRGRVFLDSLSDAFGIPIVDLVNIGSVAHTTDSIKLLRDVYSWKSLLSSERYNDMSIGKWISYIWSTQRLKADAVDTESVEPALVAQSRPDGSSVDMLDPQRFDFLFSRLFVDGGIRQEGIPVAIYNTTATPTIGTRAARMLSTYGISIISVGNETSTAMTKCRISGTKANVHSLTARFIQEYFDCEKKILESETEGGAELVLRLGTEYATQFAPQK